MITRHPVRVFNSVSKIERTAPVYYEWRSKQPSKLSPLNRAVRFLYLNRNCFNGIYRTNRSGDFNVPFASSRAGRYPTKEEFLLSTERLRKASFRAWDFGTTLRHVRHGDFVYLDPPYAVDSRRVFHEYGKKPFCRNDLSRLERRLETIDQRGAHFVVSYADCKEARDIGMKWNMRRLRVRRHVAGFSGARRSAYEVLITNIS